MNKYNKVLAREYLLADGIVSAGSSKPVSVQELEMYDVVRGLVDMYGHDVIMDKLVQVALDQAEEDIAHEEAITMDEMVAKDPTIKDEWDAFNEMIEGEDLGDVDPSSYQFPDDDDCAGGGCKI